MTSIKQYRLASELADEELNMGFVRSTLMKIGVLAAFYIVVATALIWVQDFRSESIFSPTTGKMERLQDKP